MDTANFCCHIGQCVVCNLGLYARTDKMYAIQDFERMDYQKSWDGI